MEGFFTANDQSNSAPWDFGIESSVEKMPDVMIDLESMGNRPHAPMIAIGAVTFNLVTLKIGKQFYSNIDLSSSIANGAQFDPDTVMWWLGQSDAARTRVRTGAKLTVDEFLPRFALWLNEHAVEIKSRKVWACGMDFDNTVLAEHYKRAGLEPPWMFWGGRDQRTIRELWRDVADTVKRQGTHHNALDDALHQVEILFAIRRHLAGKGKV